MTLPTPYTVTREPYSPGAKNAHGKPADAWGAPVSVPVHGWAPPSADAEPSEPNRSLVVRDLDLYAPVGTSGRPKDRWTVGGVPYLQVGYVEDFSHGPWQNEVAGVRINLQRAEG